MRIILVLAFKHLSMKMMKTLQQCIIDTYVSTTTEGPRLTRMMVVPEKDHVRQKSRRAVMMIIDVICEFSCPSTKTMLEVRTPCCTLWFESNLNVLPNLGILEFCQILSLTIKIL